MKKLLVTLLALAPLSAFAVPITSSVGTFDVTAANVRGTDAVLATTAWWNNESLAREFAALVNNDLGLSGPLGWLGIGKGPMFAYKNVADDTYYAVYFSLGGSVTTNKVDEDDYGIYAVSTPIRGTTTAVPEPASLALLGLGLLGLGLRRRRV